MCQDTASKPGKPASSMVGTSGSEPMRTRDDTAIGRSLPSRMSGGAPAGSANTICTWLPTTSVTACGMPR